jgi:hypothetical protein
MSTPSTTMITHGRRRVHGQRHVLPEGTVRRGRKPSSERVATARQTPTS